MTPERTVALLFSLPVITGVAAFALGLLIPAPVKMQFHQAQAYFFGGLLLGLIDAVLLIIYFSIREMIQKKKSR